MLGVDSTTAQNLAPVGREIVALFRTVQRSGDKLVEPKYTVEAWMNESQRFNLWADNLGLHHHGHSSLEYRLREASNLESLIKSLLEDLRRSLHDRKLFSLPLRVN